MKNTQVSDGELINQYLNGNSCSFEILLRRHKNACYSIIYDKVKHLQTTEDLFHAVFIRILEMLHKGNYTEIGRFKNYIYRSCRNAAIDHVKKQTSLKTYHFSTLGTPKTSFSYLRNFKDTTSQDVLSKLEAAEDAKHVRELLLMIPEEQREVIILRNWGGIKFTEIAKLTGNDINTVQARFRYGIKNMRKLMKLHQIEISLD